MRPDCLGLNPSSGSYQPYEFTKVTSLLKCLCFLTCRMGLICHCIMEFSGFSERVRGKYLEQRPACIMFILLPGRLSSQDKAGLPKHQKLVRETQGTQFLQIPQRFNTKHLLKYDRSVIACHQEPLGSWRGCSKDLLPILHGTGCQITSTSPLN